MELWKANLASDANPTTLLELIKDKTDVAELIEAIRTNFSKLSTLSEKKQLYISLNREIRYKEKYQSYRVNISIISVTRKQDPILWQVLIGKLLRARHADRFKDWMRLRNCLNRYPALVRSGIKAEQVLSMHKKQPIRNQDGLS